MSRSALLNRIGFLFATIIVVFSGLYHMTMHGNPFLSFQEPSAVSRVYSQHEELMGLTLDLTVRGDGAGFSGGKVDVIIVYYHSDRTVSIDEAREVWIEAAESLLELVNSNPAVEEELATWPVTIFNVEVSIRFATTEEDINQNPNRSVVSVVQVRDRLIYTTYEPGEVALGTLHEETYQEARKKVRGDRPIFL